MNLDEDDELLSLFARQCAPKEPIEPLKRRIQELETRVKELTNENSVMFEKLDQQATTIRRYRSIVRQAIQRKDQQTDETKSEVAENQDSPTVDNDNTGVRWKIAAGPATGVEARAETVVYTLSGTIPAPPKKPRLDAPPPKPSGDMIADKQIRCPTQDRSDGYAELSVGQTIWSAIVRFFNTNPNANIMTETMIIQQVGNLILGDHSKLFLDNKAITRYFTHPFVIAADDQTITVRPRIINGQTTWIVFIPEWLKAKWRSGTGPE